MKELHLKPRIVSRDLHTMISFNTDCKVVLHKMIPKFINTIKRLEFH